MVHPGTWRTIGSGSTLRRAYFGPTRIYLVGTPFHAQDLPMSMRDNLLYRFRRYAAEFDPTQLIDGHAVDVT